MKHSRIFTPPLAMYVQMAVATRIMMGIRKSSMTLGFTSLSLPFCSSSSSVPIMGTAPSRSSLPVVRARCSALRMGPKSGKISSAENSVMSTIRIA